MSDFCRVLMVEDNPADAFLVREMLRDAESVDVALTVHPTLAGAMLPVTKGLADLVLLDLSLPDAQGLEGLTALRAAAPQVPVVVFSGLADDDIAVKAVATGAQDYLVKGDVDATRLGRAIRYALERKRAEMRLAHLALHDALTGLPNRVLLADRLEHALARRAVDGVALLFIDLDGFKAVNDQHGHAVGDELLMRAAGRLSDSVRAGDTVARLGGDEFVVLCEDMENPGVASELAERVAAVLAEPYELTAGRVEISASVGLAVAGDEAAADLLHRADTAMYAAKRSGSRWQAAA